MPDWAELTAALAKDAGTVPDTPATVGAQRYEQRFGRVQLVEAIRESLHPGKARPGRAHRAFVQLPFDAVYTTNFDLLLEDAYSEAMRPFRSLVGELQLPLIALREAVETRCWRAFSPRSKASSLLRPESLCAGHAPISSKMLKRILYKRLFRRRSSHRSLRPAHGSVS
jgi:hypothetical protein